MKLLIRRLFSAITAISLLLCLLTMIAWVGSMFESVAYRANSDGHLRGIAVYHGMFVHYYGPMPNRLPLGLTTENEYVFGRQFSDWVAWKPRWYPDKGGGALFELPLLCVFLPLGILPVIVAARSLIRAARAPWKPGICPACGYDLRATPLQCPECGASGDQLLIRKTWLRLAASSLTWPLAIRVCIVIAFLAVLIGISVVMCLLLDHFILDRDRGLIHAQSVMVRILAVGGFGVAMVVSAAVPLLVFSWIEKLRRQAAQSSGTASLSLRS